MVQNHYRTAKQPIQTFLHFYLISLLYLLRFFLQLFSYLFILLLPPDKHKLFLAQTNLSNKKSMLPFPCTQDTPEILKHERKKHQKKKQKNNF
jgi:hypothetical protein